MVSTFKRWKPSRSVKPKVQDHLHRGSARERGYDVEWEKLARRWLRENPLCAECDRRGKVEPAVAVDHMVPLKDCPDRRLDVTNLQSLCSPCHNVWKRRMEAYARKARKILELDVWCRDPAARPKTLQPRG